MKVTVDIAPEWMEALKKGQECTQVQLVEKEIMGEEVYGLVITTDEPPKGAHEYKEAA